MREGEGGEPFWGRAYRLPFPRHPVNSVRVLQAAASAASVGGRVPFGRFPQHIQSATLSAPPAPASSSSAPAGPGQADRGRIDKHERPNMKYALFYPCFFFFFVSLAPRPFISPPPAFYCVFRTHVHSTCNHTRWPLSSSLPSCRGKGCALGLPGWLGLGSNDDNWHPRKKRGNSSGKRQTHRQATRAPIFVFLFVGCCFCGK